MTPNQDTGEQKTPQSNDQIQPPEERESPFVLVVEDHPLMQKTLLGILAFGGMQGLATDNGKAALALVRKHRPDLVLMDVNLRGPADGVDVLMAIRDDPKVAATPVILLTVEDTVTRTSAAGAADLVLLKPVDPNHLLTMIGRLIKPSASTA